MRGHMKEYDLTLFRENLQEMKITLSQKQEEQFLSYYELLTEWNQRMNLTAITDFQEVILKHFVDSLSLVHVVPDLEKSSFSLIDVGTGAGFPGIPLKIAFPSLRITLLDSLGKRVKFLNQVISELELTQTEAIHGRAEDYAADPVYREAYDLSVSRAVANLSTLSEYCIPFVKKGGLFISYKSEKIKEEADAAERAIRILGGKKENPFSFLLPGSDMHRTLFTIKKISATPGKYPRKAGLPGREPL